VGQPLVPNGGFETGDFSFWTLAGDPSGAYSYVDDGSLFITPFDGNYAAALGELGSLGTLSQTLPTSAGQTYLLSFWWENVDIGLGTIPCEFQVSWNGTTLLDQFDMDVFDWTNIQFLVTATGNNTVLAFGFETDNLSLFGLDDVSVTPLPKPAFQSVTHSNNTIRLTWSTVSGLVYQVQSTASMTPTSWSNLGGTLTASGSTLSASDTIGTATQRFYRVHLVP
jgi:hypothetical protein